MMTLSQGITCLRDLMSIRQNIVHPKKKSIFHDKKEINALKEIKVFCR